MHNLVYLRYFADDQSRRRLVAIKSVNFHLSTINFRSNSSPCQHLPLLLGIMGHLTLPVLKVLKFKRL